jgi:hypothetical protein
MTPNNIRKVRNAISMSQYALADKGVQATLRLRGFSCSTARC